jgi:WD40 repeat protein
MFQYRLIGLLAGVLLLGLPTAGRSQTASLPAGAIARLRTGSNPFLCLAFSPDGKRLASGGYEKTIQIWDPASGKEIRKWTGPEGNIASLAFSPDGRLLASGGVFDSSVHIWNVETGREVQTLSGLPRGTSSLAFSPDGKILAVGGYHTDAVYLWDPASGKLLAQLVGPAVPCPELEGQPRLPPDFSYVAFAPDGKTLASGHLHGLIRVWDTASRRELRHFRGPITDVFVHLAYSGDSQMLAGWGTTIRLWHAGTGKQVRQFGEQPELRISAAAYSPDSRMVASGSAGQETGDDIVHVWEVATGAERLRLSGHEYAVSAVAFSPDGRRLVSGSRDGTAIVWDLTSPRINPARTAQAAKQLDAHWQALAGRDAAQAYRAIRALAASPPQTLPYLRERLQPIARARAEQIQEWLADLNSRRFITRQQASEQLGMQAELAEPALREALAHPASPETRRRLEEILQTWDDRFFSPEQLQIVRALEVLEEIGNSDAKHLLGTVAGGTPEFRITRDARAALTRLERRRQK